MIRVRDTVRPLVPLVLTFVVVLTVDMFVSMVLAGVPRVVVTVSVSIAVWYVIARFLYADSTPELRTRRERSP